MWAMDGFIEWANSKIKCMPIANCYPNNTYLLLRGKGVHYFKEVPKDRDIALDDLFPGLQTQIFQPYRSVCLE